MKTASQIIQEAVECGKNAFLPDGIYKEKLFVKSKTLSIIGESAENTIITFDDFAEKPFGDGTKFGTFRSYTAYFGCESLYARSLTIDNSAGFGKEIGQAVAAYIDCRQGYFENVRFTGRQDTVFMTPLPVSPVIPNSFVGPNENKPREQSLIYFKDCYFEGDIDFIFGGATAIFENCEIRSLDRGEETNGFVCAPSTDPDRQHGFIFINCRLTSDCADGTVYLGRPWRKYAKCVFIDCKADGHIKHCGWDYWGNEENKKTVFFAEDATSFSSERADFSKLLSDKDVRLYTDFAKESERIILGGLNRRNNNNIGED